MVNCGVMTSEFLKLLLYLAPMYFANSSAMILGGGKTPVDLDRLFFDGKPLFGPGKTYRGLILGVCAGTIAAFIISLALREEVLTLTDNYLLLGFLLSAGAIVGDIVASFFKRRNNIAPGSEVLFLDQLDFVIGGMIFGSAVYSPQFYEVFFVCVVTLIVHKISNYIAYRAKLKKVPW